MANFSIITRVSRFRSSPGLSARSESELRNQKGHSNHNLARVIQIEKFAQRQPVDTANFSIITRVSRFRSSPGLSARSESELRNQKGHSNQNLARVIQIEKFAQRQPVDTANFSIITRAVNPSMIVRA